MITSNPRYCQWTKETSLNWSNLSISQCHFLNACLKCNENILHNSLNNLVDNGQSCSQLPISIGYKLSQLTDKGCYLIKPYKR